MMSSQPIERDSRASLARTVSVFVVFAVCSCATPSQTTPAPAAPPASGDKTLSIDVLVTDKSGINVSGLSAGDFTLLDNGVPTKVLNFEPHEARGDAAQQVHIVIVFDTINTSVITIAREREQLTEFLKQDAGKLAHPMSIGFLAESGVKLQPGSTMDGNAVLAALDKSDSELRVIGRSAGFWGATERLTQSLQQLSQIVGFEATQPGRKMLLFISPGWPMLSRAGYVEDDKQRQQVFNSLVQLTDDLAASHLELYTLDPFSLGRTNPFYYQSYLKPVKKINQAEYPNLSLQVLSEHTGGTVQVTGNDIKDEIVSALRDANSWYTLTFTPASAADATEFHALQIKVDKPDANVRTSVGYYVKVGK
jgi:VWFA-related protein